MLGAVLIAAASYAVVTPLWRIVGNTWITVAQRLYRVVMKPLIARRWVRP
jgi:undecaprenyl-diphosphatase